MKGFLLSNRRLLLLAAGVLILTAALSALVSAGPSVPTGSWGLSFRTEGQPPVGNASAQALEEFDAKYLDDSGENVLYLTFDAGYEAGLTAQILDTLKAHSAPAAFFLVGNYLQTEPELVRRMVSEGHTVGNHTMHHPDMSRIADEGAFRQELAGVEELYREITGEELPGYYRPPQGVYSEDNLRMAKDLGYRTVFWSLAYCDWDPKAQPTREQAFAKLLPRVHPGAVVLLHVTSRTNAEILDELLTRWEEMGYRFAPLPELFE